MLSAYDAVKNLSSEHPEWLPAVVACYNRTGEFAGKWILRQIGWQPNSLRPLASRGILERVDTSRGGHRAYYRMVDWEGVGRALQEEGMAVS